MLHAQAPRLCGMSAVSRSSKMPLVPVGRGLPKRNSVVGLGKERSVAMKAGRRSAASSTTVIPEPSYNLQIGLLGLAGVSAYFDNIGLAGFLGLLGVFLTFQASRLKFVFGPKALQIVTGGEDEVSDNVLVGGANSWNYDTFVNWEFWWPNFPILVYFKETQTLPEGQVHFFPIIFNGKQLYDVMVEKCGSTQNSGPK